MRNRSQPAQEKAEQSSTPTKQDELDRIERKIIIRLFGKEAIPDKTAVLFNILNIDPNKYIKMFEKKLSPMLNNDGTVSGSMLRKIIQFSKYRDILDVVQIPDEDFYLSSHIDSLIHTFIPGGNSNA